MNELSDECIAVKSTRMTPNFQNPHITFQLIISIYSWQKITLSKGFPEVNIKAAFSKEWSNSELEINYLEKKTSLETKNAVNKKERKTTITKFTFPTSDNRIGKKYRMNKIFH